MNQQEQESHLSKTQRKREMQQFKEMAVKLTTMPEELIAGIEDPKIREVVFEARKITKGNAKKRQHQYIAKLLSKTDVTPIMALVATLDAGSAAYVEKFRRLERWREQLLDENPEAMTAILENHPHVDRQQLRRLVRNAVDEKRNGAQQVHFRKLFRFLKRMMEEGRNSS